MRISEIGTFTTWPSMWWPQTVQPLPHGMTLNAASAVNMARTGARMYSGSLAADRRERLLADQLQQVGDRHEQALGAGAVRAEAQLHAAEQLPLEPGREGEEHHHDVDHDERLRDRDPPRFARHGLISTVACRSPAWSRGTRTTPA